ncbi:hypothetical protein Pcinc_001856 [Petrolisthes cinctipes]|uniref:Uncharacterized protein n=1 Tax=Petrolisthes cinctipes TaxID=88211 RepID=A0AAE1L2U9_PETCI|nr:hypothetical protein Pcinc_001856 [Petrolisthes cinctipes]
MALKAASINLRHAIMHDDFSTACASVANRENTNVTSPSPPDCRLHHGTKTGIEVSVASFFVWQITGKKNRYATARQDVEVVIVVDYDLSVDTRQNWGALKRAQHPQAHRDVTSVFFDNRPRTV